MTIFLGGTASATAMTFLALVQRLGVECSINGTGPVSVIGQVGQMGRLVNWINSAWLEIQGLHDNWNFMREDFSFNTIADVGDYPTESAIGLADMSEWHKDSFRVSRTDLGPIDEQFIVEWDYETFRDTYRYGEQIAGRPFVFAERPQGGDIWLGPKPDAVYTVTGEYQRSPTVMVMDDDTPDIPKHLHMIIVYKAMIYYGLYEAASEVLGRGELQYNILMAQLERRELPGITVGTFA